MTWLQGFMTGLAIMALTIILQLWWREIRRPGSRDPDIPTCKGCKYVRPAPWMLGRYSSAECGHPKATLLQEPDYHLGRSSAKAERLLCSTVRLKPIIFINSRMDDRCGPEATWREEE